MSPFKQILNTIADQSEMMGLNGFAMVLVTYMVLSWLICVVAAFCKVKEVQLYVGMIAMGLTLVVALTLGGLCRNFYPQLAASFTPSGLFLFSALVGILVCSVPAVQYFWQVPYWKGLFCVLGGVMILSVVYITFQVLAHPVEQLPARLAVPLFEKGAPGLSLR